MHRLFNSSFINTIDKINNLSSNWIMLETSSDIENQRHKDRNDTQSETWLKGRLTKSLKLKESIKKLTVLKNETVEELGNNCNFIMSMIR